MIEFFFKLNKRKNECCQRCNNNYYDSYKVKNNKNRIITINLCNGCYSLIELLSIVYDVNFIHYKKIYILQY
jgi:NAD-dependent SIR2 family protein deacetylase